MIIFHKVIITKRALLKVLWDVTLIMTGLPFDILTIVTFDDFGTDPTDEALCMHQPILEIYVTVIDNLVTNYAFLSTGVVALIALILALFIQVISVFLVPKRLPTIMAKKMSFMVIFLPNLYKFLLSDMFFTVVASFPVLLSVTLLAVHPTFDLVVKFLAEIFLAVLAVEVQAVVDSLVYTD
jgi:hypothetical protein